MKIIQKILLQIQIQILPQITQLHSAVIVFLSIYHSKTNNNLQSRIYDCLWFTANPKYADFWGSYCTFLNRQLRLQLSAAFDRIFEITESIYFLLREGVKYPKLCIMYYLFAYLLSPPQLSHNSFLVSGRIILTGFMPGLFTNDQLYLKYFNVFIFSIKIKDHTIILISVVKSSFHCWLRYKL